jgi:hypothetical protein
MAGEAPSLRPRPSPRLRRSGRPRPVAPGPLEERSPPRLSVPPQWRRQGPMGRRIRFLRSGDHRWLLFSPRWQRLDGRGLGTGLRRHHLGAQHQAFQGCKAEHPGVGVPTRRQKVTSANISSQKTHDKEVRSRETHLGTHLGLLHREVRQALHGGCTLQDRRLGGCSASAHRLDGGNTLPRSLGR